VLIVDLINNTLNNIIFFVANIIIDICLAIFSRKNLARKKRLVHNDAQNPGLIDDIKMRDRINRLIIVNNILSILAHFPELIAFVFVFRDEKANGSCETLYFCSKIIDSCRSFNFVVITFQIVVFYKFDRNFRNSFKDRFSKINDNKKKETAESQINH
jgi:hypothetical protein